MAAPSSRIGRPPPPYHHRHGASGEEFPSSFGSSPSSSSPRSVPPSPSASAAGAFQGAATGQPYPSVRLEVPTGGLHPVALGGQHHQEDLDPAAMWAQHEYYASGRGGGNGGNGGSGNLHLSQHLLPTFGSSYHHQQQQQQQQALGGQHGGTGKLASIGEAGAPTSLSLLYPAPSTPFPDFDVSTNWMRQQQQSGPGPSSRSSVGDLNPREVVPLFDLAIGKGDPFLSHKPAFFSRKHCACCSAPIIPALSRPAVARDGSGRFVCGTEEQHPHRWPLLYALLQ